MAHRPTSDILGVLADEVADLAGVALSIERTVSALDLEQKLGLHGRNLQRVDFLFQHLEDLAFVLQRMSDMMEDAHQLDAAELGRVARLDYVRRRLRADWDQGEDGSHAGNVDLF